MRDNTNLMLTSVHLPPLSLGPRAVESARVHRHRHQTPRQLRLRGRGCLLPDQCGQGAAAAGPSASNHLQLFFSVTACTFLLFRTASWLRPATTRTCPSSGTPRGSRSCPTRGQEDPGRDRAGRKRVSSSSSPVGATSSSSLRPWPPTLTIWRSGTPDPAGTGAARAEGAAARPIRVRVSSAVEPIAIMMDLGIETAGTREAAVGMTVAVV